MEQETMKKEIVNQVSSDTPVCLSPNGFTKSQRMLRDVDQTGDGTDGQMTDDDDGMDDKTDG